MILLTILINVATANACYSGESRMACINGNRAKAHDLSREGDACEIQFKAAQEKLLAAQGAHTTLTAKAAQVTSNLELAGAELGFLAGSREEEPALFAGGPRLRDLPQFRGGLMAWDEMVAPARAARLSKISNQLGAEEKALSEALASAGKELATSQAEATSVKARCENLHNSAQHHLQLIDNACNDICPRGPNNSHLF